ncbi:uncharacterized protein LOC123349914 [Mauremys mutica]|uniref:uncharacterized protein LOC123349914 n=1 Tax=Mauremys mutica TaxID=74926 RepID=UPI001D1668EF|nr:uncharacterized protein LOC123349914 [Mauremys mutica]
MGNQHLGALFPLLWLSLGAALLPPLDYPVRLYSESSRLSTVLRLCPAYCLYERWRQASVDPGQAPRASARIQVHVQPSGDNATYMVPQGFPVPPCSPLFEEPPHPREFAYDVGPGLACLNDTCTRDLLPGRSYRVRFALYGQAVTPVAVTNWSRPFETRGLPRSFRALEPGPGGHSGGRVIVTVLLSVSVLLLLAAMGLVLVWGRR